MNITNEQADEIYTILAEECGAPDDHMGFDRDAFGRYFTSATFPEWRFSGDLGFGGKCRIISAHPIPYVDYYPEDYSVARDNIVDRVNERIAKLFAGSKNAYV
jgi:hypothetical protein